MLLGHYKPELGQSMQPLGDGFIKLVKMIIAPVIFLTVATGIAAMSDLKKVGRVAGKAMLYFLVFSTLALVVGMVVSHIVQPGAGMHIDPKTLDTKAVSGYVAKAHDSTITGFLMNIIPTTIFSPFVGGDILQVLFVAVLFGIALAQVGERGKPVLNFLTVLAQPIFAGRHPDEGGADRRVRRHGLHHRQVRHQVGGQSGHAGGHVLRHLGAVRGDRAGRGGALQRLFHPEAGALHPRRAAAGAGHELLGSRAADADAEDGEGRVFEVRGRLVVPTGYSFNLDGTNIYMTMAALFIAQACDIPLSLGDQILLLLVAMLSSKGAAGVTGAGFITLAATLSVVPSVPVAGMALILGVDRFMSECRALTNLVGNATAAVVVARWEGELDRGQLERALDGQELPSPGEAPQQQPEAGGAGAGAAGLTTQGMRMPTARSNAAVSNTGRPITPV